ncbi:TlpA family protein disulfide reductase [Micromonospora yasonensis]|uniref:TlpA family protein disulfide reductase n=1 Tax=Micromonospora yasonensis TaxID=1128667 RepID=UPI00387393EC
MKRRCFLALTAVLAGVTGCGNAPQASDELTLRLIQPKDRVPAPEFTGRLLSSPQVFNPFASQSPATVINFWASWCAPCRLEAPQLQLTYEEYAKEGVSFVGVNSNDSETKALSFVEAFHLTYPNIFDPPGRVAAKYRAIVSNPQPGTVVVDRRGRVSARIVGGVARDDLRHVLSQTLSEK